MTAADSRRANVIARRLIHPLRVKLQARGALNLRDLAGYVAHKDVAIIGNAASIFARQDGAEIDASGVVVRLNRGFIKDPEAQGARTDILGLSFPMTGQDVEDRFAPKYIAWLTPRIRHYQLDFDRYIKNTYFYDKRMWREDRRLLHARPSSGFMMTKLMVRLGSARSVKLFGFDFGSSQTFYNPPDYVTPHDYAAEKRHMLELEKSGKISIVR